MSVIGCGYLGAVHAAAMAQLGHTVVGVDSDPDRTAALTAGRAPLINAVADVVELAGALGHDTRIDARNSLDVARWNAAGWEYRGLGRPKAGAEHSSAT